MRSSCCLCLKEKFCVLSKEGAKEGIVSNKTLTTDLTTIYQTNICTRSKCALRAMYVRIKKEERLRTEGCEYMHENHNTANENEFVVQQP